MTEQIPKVRQLVREIRDAQKFKQVALNHLHNAQVDADSNAIVAAQQVVDFASGKVERCTDALLAVCGYDTVEKFVDDLGSLCGFEHLAVVQKHYCRGQREALEGILAYTEDELSEI